MFQGKDYRERREEKAVSRLDVKAVFGKAATIREREREREREIVQVYKELDFYMLYILTRGFRIEAECRIQTPENATSKIRREAWVISCWNRN